MTGHYCLFCPTRKNMTRLEYHLLPSLSGPSMSPVALKGNVAIGTGTFPCAGGLRHVKWWLKQSSRWRHKCRQIRNTGGSKAEDIRENWCWYPKRGVSCPRGRVLELRLATGRMESCHTSCIPGTISAIAEIAGFLVQGLYLLWFTTVS